MPRHDDYPDDSELGGDPPEVHHHHYSQSKNGNGNGVLVKITLGMCGFLLALLVGMQGYMWRDQLDFQNDMIDRLARVETRLEALADE